MPSFSRWIFFALATLTLATSLTSSISQQHQEIFPQVLSFLADLERAPSCHRLAATVLIDSCKTLEPDKDINISLDRIKSSFASRLAVCEIRGANAAVPSQCSPMIPQPHDKPQKSLKCFVPGAQCPEAREDEISLAAEYAEVGQQQISDCLSALESRPQWWTSYSNARQNAISICHAARAEVEREDVLNVHKSMTALTHSAGEALEKKIKDVDERHADQQAFAASIRDLQAKIAKEMEASHKTADNRFASFMSSAEKRLSTIFASTHKGLEKANSEIETVGRSAARSSKDVEEARKKMVSMMQEASRGADAITNAQGKALATQNDITKSLDTIQQRDLNGILNAFTQLQAELRASSQLMALMFDRQSEHDQWLQGLDGALQNLAVSTVALKELQEAQIANQTDLVDLVNNKIDALGAAIDEKTQAVYAMNFFGGLSQVAWYVAISVLVVVVAVFDRRVGFGLAIFFLVTLAVSWIKPLEDWLSHLDPFTQTLVHFAPVLIGCFAVSGVLGCVAVMWIRRVLEKKRRVQLL